jgi:hypothetical protein
VSDVDVVPAPYNVRNRVHEYGGGAYLVRDGAVFFSHFADGRLYRQREGGEPEAISAEGGLRYADMILDAPRGRLIFDLPEQIEGVEIHGVVSPES